MGCGNQGETVKGEKKKNQRKNQLQMATDFAALRTFY